MPPHKGDDTAESTTRDTTFEPRNVSQGPATNLLGSPFSGELSSFRPLVRHQGVILPSSILQWELEWEGVRLTKPAHFRSVRDTFPSLDLAEKLISLYFTHVNVVYPLFHRPTFYDHWNGGLQYRDVGFTAVCMLVFAVASRWSTDPRVLGEPEPTEPGQPPRYRKVGWHYFTATVGM